jgi:hypothetical protein
MVLMMLSMGEMLVQMPVAGNVQAYATQFLGHENHDQRPKGIGYKGSTGPRLLDNITSSQKQSCSNRSAYAQHRNVMNCFWELVMLSSNLGPVEPL